MKKKKERKKNYLQEKGVIQISMFAFPSIMVL